MYFTQEDYIKIYNWLKANSVKDTQFISASELTGSETVAIVQNNINKQLKLSQLMKSFEICTFEEFEELARNGNIKRNMIYGVLRDDGDVIDTIYFGNVPFNIQGVQRTPKNVQDWEIIQNNLGTLQQNTISYLGDTLNVSFVATRQITYEWSDGRPDTIDTEYGVISFDITDKDNVIMTEVPAEQGNFQMQVTSNVGKSSIRTFTVTPKIYSKVYKQYTLLEGEQYKYNFTQGMSYIQVNSSYDVNNKAQSSYQISIYASGNPASNIPVIQESDITVLQDTAIIDTANMHLLSAGNNVYNLVFPINANNEFEKRSAIIKISSNKAQVTAQTTLTQSARASVKVTGFQLSHIKAYKDAEHSIPVEGELDIDYNENYTLYLVADEDYVLPKDNSSITMPSGVSFKYNSDSRQLTFIQPTQDIEGVSISALSLGYVTYGTPSITLSYPDEGYSGEGYTTSPNSFSYSIPRFKHYTDANGAPYTINDTIHSGATVKFSLKAYDSNGNSINESLYPTADIDETTGAISWKMNTVGYNKHVKVTVQLSIKDTNEDQQEHSSSVQATIIQPFATRTVTLNTAQSTGVNLSISYGYKPQVSYGDSINITITPKSGYDIPAQLTDSYFTISPSDGYDEASYSVLGNTGTLRITSITKNISVKVEGIQRESANALPVYIGKLTPAESGFTSKKDAIISNITTEMLEAAIQNHNIVQVTDLPRTKDNPCTVEISTQRSYFIGLVPLDGSNRGYIVRQYDGMQGYSQFSFDDALHFTNGGDIKIGNDNYKLFAVYSNPTSGMTASYIIVIEKPKSSEINYDTGDRQFGT